MEGFSETAVRLGVFLAVFAVMALLEWWRPKRPLSRARARRWPTNIGIVVIDSLVVRAMAALAVPLVAVGAAVYAQSMGWGLLHALHWPAWIEFVITLAALDFALWLQHLASHKVPMLWRLHRMHHADVDIDVTTAIRFHPIEIALSMLWKIIWVVALGAPPLAVVAFEILLNGMAMFNHANLALPPGLDRVLRAIVVTPDMHRVHHSIERREHDSNYGFNLSLWDRLFSTYVDQPELGHDKMTIGLKEFQSEAPTRLGWCLRLPFWNRSHSA
jgi:sterol desaturase/sphingolipid hydroxylase (fatty acid hydroxylase superfamily)